MGELADRSLPTWEFDKLLPRETHSEHMRRYDRLCAERQRIISENKARRWRKGLREEMLVVPPKPERPMVPVAYEADGTYCGVLGAPEECPEGCYVKWELAVR